MNDFDRDEHSHLEDLGSGPTTHQSPVRLVAIVAILVFVAEALVMLLLSFLPPFSTLSEALVDSVLLIVLLSPVLYLFLFRPLVLHITARVRSEEERMRAVEALAYERDLFHALMDNTPDRIYFKDSQGRYIRINRALADLHGLDDPAQAVGKTDFDFFVSERALQFQADEQEVMRSGRPVVGKEEKEIWLDGRETWSLTSTMPFRDEKGRIIGCVGVARDITARIRSEEERERVEVKLRAEKERAQKYLDIVRVVLIALDSDGRVTLINKRGQEILGYREEELVGKDWFETCLPERLRESVSGVFKQLMEGEAELVEYYENPILIRDGEERLIAWHSTILWDVAGNIVGTLSSGEDITERVHSEEERARAEEALREERDFAESLVNTAQAIILVLDAKGRIVRFNPYMEEISGYSLAEVRGKDWVSTFLPARDRSVIRDLFQKAVSDVQTWGNVSSIVAKDGSERGIEWYDKVMKDADGNVVGLLAIGLDITERVQIERQLRQQERLAAVGQLAGGIAHDFNNLLTTILLYAQMPLGQPDLPPVVGQAFETIVDETHRAADLVQQILDFSRRSLIETYPLDLELFIKESIRMLERTIPENIALQLDIEPGEYVVRADPTRIQQVVLNLALNARDAMPEGGEMRFGLSRVTVGPEESPPVVEMGPGEWVCLTVSDTGIGISSEALPHIFEPFFTTKEAEGGTGLGLAQVHGIVGQHEGRVGVETELGKGTNFRVYLPVHREDMEHIAEEVSTSSRGRGEIILLVEDEENVREAGREILESLGYRVVMAEDGREALDVYASTEGVDLVITDIVMPKMDGRTLMRELKKADPHLRVLAITGYALVGDLEVLKEEGFLNVVQKPFDGDSLARAARQALDEEIEQ